jgi:hypothetical protein
MPFKKILFKPGVDRESTMYASEGGWYDGYNVRFRSGYPEKIGGWERLNTKYILGVGRSLRTWNTLGGLKLIGVGTQMKFYIEMGGKYYDITPIRVTTAAGDVTFSATNGVQDITVTDVAHGATVYDFVTFSDSNNTGFGGNITGDIINQEYQIIEVVDSNTYKIQPRTVSAIGDIIDGINGNLDPTVAGGSFVSANSSDASGASGAVTTVGTYQINIGADNAQPINGWGSGTWGQDAWDHSGVTTDISNIRLWSQSNFGEDLVFGFKGGVLYYWDASNGVNDANRGVLLSSRPGASDVPTVQNHVMVSDNRFVFCFGVNPLGSASIDPMLVRWSDQEDPTNWTPSAENQAGSLPLARGSEIVTAMQGRQEILVWTDSSLYAFSYIGGQAVWGQQLVGDNISIISKNAVAYAAGMAFWMGKDQFYIYDGTVRPLPCKVKKYVFAGVNLEQLDQINAGTNEAFNEIWWFYNGKYVVYNYVDDLWFYGLFERSAWVDSGIRDYPIGVLTYENSGNSGTVAGRLLYHEKGIDDNSTGAPSAINASITSATFDLDDGHKFMFVDKVLPDVLFSGSDTTASPTITMEFLPFPNSGSGVFPDPPSVGGIDFIETSGGGTVVYPGQQGYKQDITYSGSIGLYGLFERYTENLNFRFRGRQVLMKITSNKIGTQWQLGAQRLRMRPDGRR